MADGWFWRGVGDIYDEGSNEFITVEGNGIAIAWMASLPEVR